MRSRANAKSKSTADTTTAAAATGTSRGAKPTKRKGKGKRKNSSNRLGSAVDNAGNDSDGWEGIGLDTEGAALYAKAVAQQWQSIAESQTIGSIYAQAYAHMKPANNTCLYLRNLVICLSLSLLTCLLFIGPKRSLLPVRDGLHHVVNTHRDYLQLAQLADAALHNMTMSELYILDDNNNDDKNNDTRMDFNAESAPPRRQVSTSTVDFLTFLFRRAVLRDHKYTPSFGLIVNHTYVNSQLLNSAQQQLELELAVEESKRELAFAAALAAQRRRWEEEEEEQEGQAQGGSLMQQVKRLSRSKGAHMAAEFAKNQEQELAKEIAEESAREASEGSNSGAPPSAASTIPRRALPPTKPKSSTIPKVIRSKYQLQMIPDAFNPLLGNDSSAILSTSDASSLNKEGKLSHHQFFNMFGQYTGTAESEYIIDWLGVRTRHEYDCTSQASLRTFLASRRVSCAKHEKLLQKLDEEERERIERGGVARKLVMPDIEGEFPAIDQEYLQYIFVLGSVLASDPDDRYVVGDIGARYGLWGTRALAAYRKYRKRESYTMVAIEPHTDRLVHKHASANGMQKALDLLSTPVRTPVDLLDMLERAPTFDLLMLNNVEGYEAAVFGSTSEDTQATTAQMEGTAEIDNINNAATTNSDRTDGNNMPTSTEVMQTLENRVKRLFVRVASTTSYHFIKTLLLGKGWHMVIDLPRTAKIKQCDKWISPVDEDYTQHASCSSATPWGPVYVREGMLAFVNPTHVKEFDSPVL